MLAPAAPPQPIKERVHGEGMVAVETPEVRQQLSEQLGMDLAISTPELFSIFLAEQVARWGKVVKDNNIKPD